MLAGYLPFDDDPANPEGDNINLLYKYIVSTPLTFPEYVTPHARDLLRRILVPDPRRRADLFEVARHSWLSEYSHVLGFIGSNTQSDRDLVASARHPEEEPILGRSASVREPAGRSPVPRSAGSMQKAPATAGGDETSDMRSQQQDTKRHTVQMEYVKPNAAASAVARGEVSPITTQAPSVAPASARTRARAEGSGPVAVVSSGPREPSSIPRKDIPAQSMPPPARATRDQTRAASDSAGFVPQSASASRPNTGNTLGGGARLPSRGNSYSQPSAATPTNTNVQGHFSQPKPGTGYIISPPISAEPGTETTRPASQHNLAQFHQHQPQDMSSRGHKRSSTLGSIGDRLLGRSNSRRSSKQPEAGTAGPAGDKRDRRYPPISMKTAALPADEAQPRPSSESRRSSFGFNRKNSEIPTGERRTSRRFSFLPNGFTMNSFSGKKDQPYDSVRPQSQQPGARPQSKGMAFGRGESPAPSQSTANTSLPLQYDAVRRSGAPQPTSPYDKPLPLQPSEALSPIQRKQYRDDGYGGNILEPDTIADPPERFYTPAESNRQQYVPSGQDQYDASAGQPEQYDNYAAAVDDGYDNESPIDPSRQGVQNIRPQQRKFESAYDQGHAGSSSGARRVMDFFRRRGKDRSQD